MTLARLAALAALALAALATPADVIVSNLFADRAPGTSLGIGSSSNSTKAFGFVTGPHPERLETITLIVSTVGSSRTIFSGIHADNAGNPGALITPFETIVGTSLDDVTVVIRPTRVVILQPETTYWIRLSSPGPNGTASWDAADALPRTIPGTRVLGYRLSSNGGSSWSDSDFFNAVEIATAPIPALANLPAPSFSGSLAIDGLQTAAIGITTGPRPAPVNALAATLQNVGVITAPVVGGIYADSAGAPGAFLVAFRPVSVPALTPPTETRFVAEEPFTLAPNTTYWFRLGSTPGSGLRWAQASPPAAPTPADGFAFAGLRASANGGATWSASTAACAVAVLLDREPLLTNLPAEPSLAGTSLGANASGFDGVKALGLSTDGRSLDCLALDALIENATGEPRDIFGGVYTDASGNPGDLITPLRAVTVPAGDVTTVRLRAENPFARLAPNSTAWFVLDAEDGVTLVDWLTTNPAAAPIPAPGYAAAGYRFSGNGGTDWSGSTVFNGAAVRGRALCAADLDADGSVNFDDIDAFVTAFLGADLLADCDGDAALNFDDIDCFVASFLAGCG